MKLGAENRNKTIAAGVLALFAIVLFWRSFFVGGPALQSAPPAPAQVGPAVNQGGTPAPNTPNRRRANQVAGVAVNPLDPRLRLDLLKASQDIEYAGSGRNIFLAQAEPEIPTPVKNPVRETQKEPPPVITPPVHQTPPLPFQAFGMATGPGLRKVMLVEGEDVFVAKQGDVIKGQYKIVKINPTSVEIQDLLTNNTQTIPISAG